MRYAIEERTGKAPVLIGKRDGKRFLLQSENPIEKVYRYKQEIHELYCPRGKRGQGKRGQSPFRDRSLLFLR